MFSTYEVIFKVIFCSLHGIAFVFDALHKYNKANDSTNVFTISKYYYCIDTF